MEFAKVREDVANAALETCYNAAFQEAWAVQVQLANWQVVEMLVEAQMRAVEMGLVTVETLAAMRAVG